jgi:hypothetical protein
VLQVVYSKEFKQKFRIAVRRKEQRNKKKRIAKQLVMSHDITRHQPEEMAEFRKDLLNKSSRFNNQRSSAWLIKFNKISHSSRSP